MPLTSVSRNSRRYYQPLVPVLACVAAGIAVDRYAPPRSNVWWLASALALAGWFAAQLAVRNDTTRRLFGSILAALACLAVGGARHHGAWYLFSPDDIGAYAAEEPRVVRIEGVLIDAPRTAAPPQRRSAGGRSFGGGYPPDDVPRTRFTLQATKIRQGSGVREVDGLVDVQIDGPWPEGEAGSRVQLFGRLASRSPPMNPGEFDFAAHFRADRKPAALRVNSADLVKIVERRGAWNLPARISEWRRDAHQRLLENLPADQVGFATALLLGYRDQMTPADNEAFFRTGTVHILSISGLHVAMLAMFLHCGLRIGWVGRRTAAAVIIGVTVAYGVLIDAEPPAVRAVIVIAAVGLATIAGRRPPAFNVLAASALVVLAMNPNDLFRIGPQLSFLAAAVLAWWAERRARGNPDEQPDSAAAPDVIDLIDPAQKRAVHRRALKSLAGLGRGLIVSAAILGITTPLVAHRFHIFSPISLVLTPLLALPVAMGLLFGLLTLVTAVIVPPLAPLLGAVCGFSLRLIETTVVYADGLPAATYWLPGPSLEGTIAFYAILAVWVLLPERTWRRRIAGAALLGWGVVSMIPYHNLPSDCRVRCTFIAVDHGLSVLVESRSADGAEAWLYDCGRLGSGDAAARSIAGVLWSRGITRLEGIVISHADADHYNGLPTLLKQFGVDQVVLSKDMARSRDAAAAGVRAAVAKAGVPLVSRSDGEFLPWNGRLVECRVLHPPAAGGEGSDNARSLVVEITAAKRRILLTGDLEGAGLERLLARKPVDYDVLLAPHHGSSSSNPPGLASWSTPELVVVSGLAESSSPMRAAYEAASARVLATTAVGAVTVTIDGQGRIEFETFRPLAPYAP